MPKIHKMLDCGPRDRKEMERRVETLLAIAQEETVVITIVVRGERANYGVIGRAEPQVFLQSLDVVRDDILMAMARQEQLKPQEGAEGPPEPDLTQVSPLPPDDPE